MRNIYYCLLTIDLLMKDDLIISMKSMNKFFPPQGLRCLMSSVDILEAVDPTVDNLDTNSVRNLTGAR